MKGSIKDTPSNLPACVRWPSEESKGSTASGADGDKLLLAVLMGKKRTLKKLCNMKGLSPDTLTSDGQTPLFCAAYLGKKDIVKCLLKLGANPNARCLPEGYTSVHGACFSGSVGILHSLIQHGGDLRLTDTKRRSAVDWTDFQINVGKRRKLREFIEAIRLETLKSVESATAFNKLSLEIEQEEYEDDTKLVKFLKRVTGKKLFKNKKYEVTQVTLNGFGPCWIHNGVKYSGGIGLPSLSEVTDLKLESDKHIPSWICGKFSTFIPMVWAGKNTSVTVKSLRFKSVEEAVPDILIAELNTLVTLQHPRILMLLAVSQEQNYSSISLVFEKVTYGSLYFFLHNSNLRMSCAFATDLIRQISEALDFVHGRGFLHCGVSSHAIMLVGDNQAKLGCFEYAVPEVNNSKITASRHPWLDSDSHLNVIRHWVAPEVLTKTQKASRASDVYSLCCVMWELVLGDLPWKDHSLESLRDQFLKSPGIRLPLNRAVIPSFWWSTLTVGLKTKVHERDLDLTEIRYMMNLAKNKMATPSGSTSLLKRVSKSTISTTTTTNSTKNVQKAPSTVESKQSVVRQQFSRTRTV